MQLSLYAYDACPHCQRVYRAIEDLGIEVEKRDVLAEPEYRDELRRAVGRGTVPVLRIDDEGETRWLPESRDIVAWLHAQQGRTPPRGLELHRWASFGMWGLLVVGLFFPEHRLIAFGAALAIGAARSIYNALTTRTWTHALIAVMFVFGGVAVVLQVLGVAEIPWWYGVYALVAVLLMAAIVLRLFAKKRAADRGLDRERGPVGVSLGEEDV